MRGVRNARYRVGSDLPRSRCTTGRLAGSIAKHQEEVAERADVPDLFSFVWKSGLSADPTNDR